MEKLSDQEIRIELINRLKEKVFKEIDIILRNDLGLIKLIAISDISDCMGNKIFGYVDEDMMGCLIFCDINAYANWQHDCKYIFIAESGKMITKLHTMPPNEKNSNTQDE